MVVEKDAVVSFHYRLSEPGQPALEDSHGGAPLSYLHGHHGMLPGLEEALAGKCVGDVVAVTLAPEQAYGLRQENAIQRVSLKHIASRGKKLQPGMVVRVSTDQGPRDVVVVKAGLKTVDVDTNHPLAGKTLSFDIEIVAVRRATDEELAHGHAHGEGGHPH